MNPFLPHHLEFFFLLFICGTYNGFSKKLMHVLVCRDILRMIGYLHRLSVIIPGKNKGISIFVLFIKNKFILADKTIAQSGKPCLRRRTGNQADYLRYRPVSSVIYTA